MKVSFQKPSFSEKEKIFTKAAGEPNVQISKGIKTYFLLIEMFSSKIRNQNICQQLV